MTFYVKLGGLRVEDESGTQSTYEDVEICVEATSCANAGEVFRDALQAMVMAYELDGEDEPEPTS